MRRTDMAIKYRISEVFDISLKKEGGVTSIVFDTRVIRFELVLDDDAKSRELAGLLGIHVNPPPAPKKGVKMPRLYTRDIREREDG